MAAAITARSRATRYRKHAPPFAPATAAVVADFRRAIADGRATRRRARRRGPVYTARRRAAPLLWTADRALGGGGGSGGGRRGGAGAEGAAEGEDGDEEKGEGFWRVAVVGVVPARAFAVAMGQPRF